MMMILIFDNFITKFHKLPEQLSYSQECNLNKLKPEAHGPQRSPECTAMKAIFSQNTVNVACKKN